MNDTIADLVIGNQNPVACLSCKYKRHNRNVDEEQSLPKVDDGESDDVDEEAGEQLDSESPLRDEVLFVADPGPNQYVLQEDSEVLALDPIQVARF